MPIGEPRFELDQSPAQRRQFLAYPSAVADPADRRPGGADGRRNTGELALQRGLLGARPVELAADLGDLPADVLQAREIALLTGQGAGVPLLELGQPPLGLVERAALDGDLLVDEPAGHRQFLAADAQIGRDEDFERGCDDPLGGRRIAVAIGDGEQVPALRGDPDAGLDVGHEPLAGEGVGCPARELGAVDHPLEVRPAQDRPLHDVELPGEVGFDRDPLQQRAEHAVGVGVDPRRALVAARQEHDHEAAHDRHGPGDRQASPATAPDEPDEPRELVDRLLHGAAQKIASGTTKTSPGASPTLATMSPSRSRSATRTR